MYLYNRLHDVFIEFYFSCWLYVFIQISRESIDLSQRNFYYEIVEHIPPYLYVDHGRLPKEKRVRNRCRCQIDFRGITWTGIKAMFCRTVVAIRRVNGNLTLKARVY